MTAAAALAPVVLSTVGTAEWFALLDRELRCVHLHRGRLGRIPEQLIGLPDPGAPMPSLTTPARRAAGSVIQDGATQETEIAFEDPRFGPRRFEFEFRPLHAGAEIVGVIVRAAESTARHMQAGAWLLQSRLLECLTDAVLVVDPARVIRFANPAAAALFGLEADQLTGQPVSALGGAFSAWLGSAPDSAADLWGAAADACCIPATLILESKRHPLPLQVRCRASALNCDGQRYHVIAIDDLSELRLLERNVVEAETRERERLARDMHDGIGQELTSVALMLRALDIEGGRGKPAAESTATSRIGPIVDIVNGVIRSTSELARGVFARPAVEHGLQAALERLAQRAAERSGARVECRIGLPSDYPLAAPRADHLFHIAQEATTNALRHGQATHIRIELALEAGVLRLTICDDGRGIPAVPVRAGQGLGLSIMRYRAHAAGGELRIEARTPRGTQIEYRSAQA